MKATSLPALFCPYSRQYSQRCNGDRGQEKRENRAMLFTVSFLRVSSPGPMYGPDFSPVSSFFPDVVFQCSLVTRHGEKTPREPEEICFSYTFSVTMRSCFHPRQTRSIFQLSPYSSLRRLSLFFLNLPCLLIDKRTLVKSIAHRSRYMKFHSWDRKNKEETAKRSLSLFFWTKRCRNHLEANDESRIIG